MSDRYEILTFIGKDHIGEVYMAMDTTLQRKVVYRKFISEETVDIPEDFATCTGKLCSLYHPNLLTVYDVGCDDEGHYYMVSQLIEGEKLKDRLQRGPLSQTGVFNMASDLLDALHAIHHADMFHGSLGVQSVERISKERGGHRYLIVDLGLDKIAMMLGWDVDTSLDIFLQPPEILAGDKPSVSTDLFVLGQLCYLSLLGSHPMAGKSSEECAQVYQSGGLTDIRQLAPDVQDDFGQWIMSLLVPDQNQRVVTVEDAMATFHAIQMQTPKSNVPGVTQAVIENASSTQSCASQPVEDSPQDEAGLGGRNKKKWMMLGGLVATVILLVVLGVKMFGGKDDVDKKSKISHDGPVYLIEKPEYVHSMEVGASPYEVELDSDDTLDWTVVKGVPISLERIDCEDSTYITSVVTKGNFKEILQPSVLLSYHGNGMKFKPNIVMTDVKRGHAEFGDGWEIMFHIPLKHKGPMQVVLYMMQDRCDFVVEVKLPHLQIPQRFEIQSKDFGGKSGVVKIPIEIAKPKPGAFYTVRIKASQASSDDFSMALDAVLVKKGR